MDVPGRESEYKDELYQELNSKYEISDLSVTTLDEILQYSHSGILPFATTEYLGIVDKRSITPESMERSLSDLMDRISEETSVLDGLSNEPHLIIIGVTEQITSPVREYIDNEASKHNRTYPFEMYVVDVSAGTVLGTGRKYAPFYGEQLKENYLEEPLE